MSKTRFLLWDAPDYDHEVEAHGVFDSEDAAQAFAEQNLPGAPFVVNALPTGRLLRSNYSYAWLQITKIPYHGA